MLCHPQVLSVQQIISLLVWLLLYYVWLVLSMILMINLLIAMLTNTFDKARLRHRTPPGPPPTLTTHRGTFATHWTHFCSRPHTHAANGARPHMHTHRTCHTRLTGHTGVDVRAPQVREEATLQSRLSFATNIMKLELVASAWPLRWSTQVGQPDRGSYQVAGVPALIRMPLA